MNRARARACRLNKRQPRGSRTLQAADVAALYALRPTAPELWYLSPYEDLQNAAAWWDVDVSPAGLEKLQRAEGGQIELLPGYTLKEPTSPKIRCFDDVPATESLRHAWLLRRRPRPLCPSFGWCPTPRRRAEEREENARIVSVYFRPWTMRQTCADVHVPFGASLRCGHTSWEDSLRGWLDGAILCEETKHYVSNFLSVYRMRPADAENEANSDDAVSDEELQLTAADIPECFESTAMGSGEGAQASCVSARREQIFLAACADANATWGSGDVAAAACGETLDETFVGDVERATRAARREKQSASRQTLSSTAWPESNPSLLRQPCSDKAADAERWLSDVATRCNAEQLSFLKHVVQRVACEERNVLFCKRCGAHLVDVVFRVVGREDGRRLLHLFHEPSVCRSRGHAAPGSALIRADAAFSRRYLFRGTYAYKSAARRVPTRDVVTTPAARHRCCRAVQKPVQVRAQLARSCSCSS